MLVTLARRHILSLSQHLELLSNEDKRFFKPHDYDIAALESLLSNHIKHYYIYYDKVRNFAGYGMVRAWEGYDAPTIGCVIWSKYRRRGNGTRLVNELVEKTRELGYLSAKLKVSPKNSIACRLYKRVGFIETGETAQDSQIWMEYKFDEKQPLGVAQY